VKLADVLSRALPVALVALVFAAGLTAVADGDIFWHLAAGRHMVETGQLLRADPFSGVVWVFRAKRAKLSTFCIRFSIRDGRLPLASVVRPHAAGLAVSARQGVDVHLHGAAAGSFARAAELDVRRRLLRRHDARAAADQHRRARGTRRRPGSARHGTKR
jgi:hypothetical protein